MRLLSRLNAWFKHICSWKDPRASWEVVFCIALLCYYPSTAIQVVGVGVGSGVRACWPTSTHTWRAASRRSPQAAHWQCSLYSVSPLNMSAVQAKGCLVV